MSAAIVKPIEKNTLEEESDDIELQNDLKVLVDKITGPNTKLIPSALEMMKYLIRTSTTSMTSVPKPLKYLAPYYNLLKETHTKMPEGATKKSLSDIISALAMGTAGDDSARKNLDCLRYCLQGSMKNIGDWGHEYIRQLESEIVQQLTTCERTEEVLLPLVKDIVDFDCRHHAEIQACDLLMEIGKLPMLEKYITPNIYQRICLYLTSCAKYIYSDESNELKKFTCNEYLKFGEYTQSLIIALQLRDNEMVNRIFASCTEKIRLYQMAFICSRHLYAVDYQEDYADEVNYILSNNHLSSYFLQFARELDIMEPKSPEEVYKTWLEPTPPRLVLGEKMDSARQNLASSFVNGFVNAGFGTDKLLTPEGGNKWIYRNKDHGMMSATAALGLLHLWDVDGGLTPIDKYLYSSEDYIKSGALLALGIVNCRVRDECDPAFALLSDYVMNPSHTLQVGAILGIGLAYAGTGRQDVLNLLLPVLDTSLTAEVLGITSIACGLVSLGRSDNNVANTIMFKLIEYNNQEILKAPYMRLVAFGVALCFYGAADNVDVPHTAMEIIQEPFRTMIQTMLQMCAYANTGDVLIIQELLGIISEKVEIPEEVKKKDEENDKDKSKKGSSTRIKDNKKTYVWDYNVGQALATLAVAVVSKGEEIGDEMIHRILGHVGRYGEPTVRKAVPLAIAFASLSNPQISVIDVLTKYSHDSEDDVACNAIFGLGLVGAGTNHARLAQGLRHLAAYHNKNPSQLFMVRLAQGLVHMGKGTMTLNPVHTDRQLVDHVAMAGLLITSVALLDPHSLILARSHYLLYTLVTAIQPRWLLTLSDDLQTVTVPVRVGQAVDTVGKAGTPKTIAGIHTHTTPVLLAAGERAELATDQYQVYVTTLDGICILKKKPENM